MTGNIRLSLRNAYGNSPPKREAWSACVRASVCVCVGITWLDTTLLGGNRAGCQGEAELGRGRIGKA